MTAHRETDEARTEAFLTPLKRVRPARARSLQPPRRRSSRALAVALAGLVVSSTAVAAVSGWSPLVGSTGRGGEPTLSEGPVPAKFKAALSVLRRPARPIDRSAEVRGTLNGVGAELVQGLHLNSVRYLADAPGDAASILFFADGSEFPVYNSDGSLAFISEDEGNGSVCVYSPLAAGTERGEAPSGCFSLHQLQIGEAISQTFRSGNTPDDPGETWAFGLVPDGVATVEARFYPGGSELVPVKNNFFELHRPSGDDSVQCTTWLDATGEVISRQPVWRGEQCR